MIQTVINTNGVLCTDCSFLFMLKYTYGYPCYNGSVSDGDQPKTDLLVKSLNIVLIIYSYKIHQKQLQVYVVF